MYIHMHMWWKHSYVFRKLPNKHRISSCQDTFNEKFILTYVKGHTYNVQVILFFMQVFNVSIVSNATYMKFVRFQLLYGYFIL